MPALQRRTVTTPAGSQVLGGVGVSAGAAVAALVVARVMAAKGRCPGLTTGYLLAIAGGLLIVAASVVGSFVVLLAGGAALLLGLLVPLGRRFGC